METLQKIIIPDFVTEKGKTQEQIVLSYQIFGKSLGSAPIVLVNHALTGNSQVTEEGGWWKELIGRDKTIDTDSYTVLSFNIPGNGYDGINDNLIYNYTHFLARDVARIFWRGLEHLQINTLFAVVGGSLGGGIAWEMAALKPNAIENLIPIACDWKANDWVIANTFIQDEILNNSNYPLADARLHAMLLYRTPQSLNQKFNREKDPSKDKFKVESWLIHHQEKLQNRFQLSSYKLMNHLLKTIDITRNYNDFNTIAKTLKSNIHIIAVDTDYLFTAEESFETYSELKKIKNNVCYDVIKSPHGHDAFLIEYEQLNSILGKLFIKDKQTV